MNNSPTLHIISIDVGRSVHDSRKDTADWVPLDESFRCDKNFFCLSPPPPITLVTFSKGPSCTKALLETALIVCTCFHCHKFANQRRQSKNSFWNVPHVSNRLALPNHESFVFHWWMFIQTKWAMRRRSRKIFLETSVNPSMKLVIRPVVIHPILFPLERALSGTSWCFPQLLFTANTYYSCRIHQRNQPK